MNSDEKCNIVGGYVMGAVLHRSAAARNTPYPRWISGGAFEMRATEFGHPVE
ncbi:MAG: hypothetical protein ACI8R4_001933, partial [Paracoccaceae bacterium]